MEDLAWLVALLVLVGRVPTTAAVPEVHGPGKVPAPWVTPDWWEFIVTVIRNS